MTWIRISVLALAALAGTAVVLTRDPLHQLILVAYNGLILVAAFVLFQAPDVALSLAAIGALAPLMMALLTLVRARSSQDSDSLGTGGSE